MALLQECHFSYRLHLVPDAEEAVAFLRRLPPYPDAPRPHLLIVDLHFPHGEGWNLLAAARATPLHADVPVVLLIGGTANEGGERRAQGEPTLCLLKPLNLTEYQNL